MLPARRVAKAALPPASPAAGTPGQNLPAPTAYNYGPGTSHSPGNASSFGGGAYHGPTSDGYGQRAPDADYAESVYVEQPRYEEPRQAQGNSEHQEAYSWFNTHDQSNHEYQAQGFQDQGFQAPEYRAPDYPAYGGRHRNEGRSGQGPQHLQGGYQGGGFAAQQPAPDQAVPGQLPTRSQTPPVPPVPPNPQGYRDQSAAGYPGPSGGYSAQATPQFGNGYPGRPATDFPPSANVPPAPNGFLPPPASPPPSAGSSPTTGYPPPVNGYPPPGALSSPPPNGFPAPQAGGFQSPPAGSPSAPTGSPLAPPGGFQSPPAGSPFAPPGFPSSPGPGEFPGFQSPNFPGAMPGQQEGFQQTPQFPGAQFGQMPFGGPAAPPATATTPWYQRLGSGKPRLLIGGAVAVVVVAGGAALAVPKLLGSSDPGCASYTGNALTAYNQTISDLNAQASQSQLTSDMTTAITDLTTAANQAKSATVKSALDGLSSELSTVRADVQKGSVPAQTVAALNSASRAADNAC
jgi:hypothetical protein